jgi:hypothetical protein
MGSGAPARAIGTCYGAGGCAVGRRLVAGLVRGAFLVRAGDNGNVIDEAQLRQMSVEERRQLARALAAIDLPHPRLDPAQIRRRRIGIVLTIAICVFLVGWIILLMLTLPRHYTASHWRGVWVGLDIAELAAFTVTAWAAWHQRQMVIFCMVFTGTLLLSDAWFDLMLDAGTSGFTMSVVAAIFAEIPMAFFLFHAARRLVRITVETVMRLEGFEGPVPPLWRVPLFADGLLETLPARLRGEAESAGRKALWRGERE